MCHIDLQYETDRVLFPEYQSLLVSIAVNWPTEHEKMSKYLSDSGDFLSNYYVLK